MSDYLNTLVSQDAISSQCYDIYGPKILNLQKTKDNKILSGLLKKKKVWNVIDETADQQKELYFVKNPKVLNSKNKKRDVKTFDKLVNKEGHWIYYPWSGQLVHILKPADFKKLRLSRNRNLITKSEQKAYEKITVAFAGLNVGNAAAIAIALEGGSTKMRFIDNDVLTLSNLNRFRAGLHDLGINKAILSARQIYEINPYADIRVFSEGLTEKRIGSFLLKPKIDILIEEMDELTLKIEIRKFAKKYRIPVVMVTGNAENVILDIERYDKEANLKILNGKLSPTAQADIKKGLHTQSLSNFGKLCQDFIGRRYLKGNLKESFQLLGKNLASIPQLAECSFLRGAVLSFVVRMIALKKSMPSGRYNVRLDHII